MPSCTVFRRRSMNSRRRCEWTWFLLCAVLIYLDDAGSSIQTGVADTYVAYEIGIRKVGPCTMMAVARLCRKWLEELRWKLGQARVVSPGFGTEKSRISHPNTGISMTAIHYCYLLAGHKKQQLVLFWKLWSEIRLSKQDNDLDGFP